MMDENEIATLVLDSCFLIHRKIGPGVLESAYEAVLSYELGRKGLTIERQVPLPMIWDDLVIKECYRADMIVDHKVIVELKSVERILLVHRKQVLTYLRITGCKLGLLVNFGAGMMKDGITRVVNGLAEDEGVILERESRLFLPGG